MGGASAGIGGVGAFVMITPAMFLHLSQGGSEGSPDREREGSNGTIIYGYKISMVQLF